MVYRPTVRYPNIYKDYINEVYKATRLDRNQIMRLALFASAHSVTFNNILKKYKAGDVPLPSPEWGIHEERYWLDQNYSKKQDIQESIKIVDQGGITFRLD